MSIDYVVTYQDSPAELETQILDILASHGFNCEFAPDTSLLDVSQDEFLIKVSAYPSPKPRVRPDRSFLAGAGLDNMPDVAQPTHRRLTISTSSGRTRLDQALQLLVAAAIAQLTGGTFHDPQGDISLDAHEAVEYAAREIRRGDPPHDLREREFTGWTAES